MVYCTLLPALLPLPQMTYPKFLLLAIVAISAVIAFGLVLSGQLNYLIALLTTLAISVKIAFIIVSLSFWASRRAERRRTARRVAEKPYHYKGRPLNNADLQKIIEGVTGPAPTWLANLQGRRWEPAELKVIADNWGKIRESELTRAVQYAGRHSAEHPPRTQSAVRNKAHRMRIKKHRRLHGAEEARLIMKLNGGLPPSA